MKKSLLILTALAAGGAFADTHWTGANSTDWAGTGNWWNSGGNWVIGGAQSARLPSSDPILITFAKKETIGSGLWVENENKADVVWDVADGAEEEAGITSTWGTNNSLNIGTGKHGGLTVNGGTYYFPKQLWIGNGGASSFFTLNDGNFTMGAYTCIAYGNYARTCTMTVNGGRFTQNGNAFIIGQGNHGSSVGIFNQTGGAVDVKYDGYLPENSGKGIMNLTGGTFSLGQDLFAPRGNDKAAELTIDGGDLYVKRYVNFGHGQRSTAKIDVKSGSFHTDNELILGTATGANVEMTLSGGTFTPKKFWIASHYNHSNGGVTAKLTMTGGTLETLQTGNGEDFVIGGNGAATGTFEMQGGRVNVGQTLYVGWRGTGIMKMSGGDVYLRAGKEMSIGSKESASTSGSVELTGGTIHTDTVNMQTAYGEKSFLVNGGSFAPVTDTTTWLSAASFTVGENGIGLNADGHTATLCANLVPAEEGGKIKVVLKGATGKINFAEATLAQIDTIAVADGGSLAFTMGDELAKPIEIQEGGRLTIDVTGIVTDGAYDLGTFTGGLTLAEGVTLSSENVTLIGLPGSADAVYAISETGVLSVTLSGMEKLVFNSDNVAWGAENVWKGEKSGVAKTFGPTDKAIFLIEEDETVQTVLVNEEIAPMGVEVIATGANSYPLIKGHGTFAPQELSVTGTIGLAGDEEGPLNLNVKLEETKEGDVSLSQALFESGTVNLLTSLHMPSTVNGTLVRETDWTPSYPIDGTGEIQIKNCKLTLDTHQALKDFKGTVTLGPGATLDDAKDLNQAPVLGGATLKMNGATISRFSWNDAGEYLSDVEVVEGTENHWWNQQSRGNMGANVQVRGNVSGGGKLVVHQKNWQSARWMRFYGDFTGFTGELEMHGILFEFAKLPLCSGTFVVASDCNISSADISIDKDVTWLMHNNDDYNLTCLAGATIGGNGAGVVKNLTLNENVSFKFTDEAALSDTKAEYVALTVTNPIVGPLPTIANANAVTTRGKWKLVQRANKKTVTDAETGVESEVTESYSLVAQFRPMGFVIILQ